MFSSTASKNSGNLVNFDIYFLQGNILRSDPIYYPDEELNGYCIVNCKGRIKIDSIDIKLIGKAETSFNVLKETQTQEIIYISEEQNIYKPNLEKGKSYLRDGFHKFKFNFRLPDKLPSSFNHLNGYIRYSIKAMVYKPFLNQQVERFFTIHSPLDPSEYPETTSLPKRVEAENFSAFCHWLRCFPNGSVFLEAQTDKTVYKIGDVITMNCVFKNSTNSSIEPEAKLKQNITFTANGYQRSKVIVIAGDFITPTLQPNVCLNFIAKIDIPKHLDEIPLPATMVNCPLIQITYTVVIALRKAAINLPIVIENN